MAAEQRRAPRVVGEQTSMSAAAAASAAKADSHAKAAEILTGYSLNNCTPFFGDAVDLAYQAASHAHALTLVLSNAITDAADPATDQMSSRPCHVAQAVDAIGMLLALSLWAHDAGSAQ